MTYEDVSDVVNNLARTSGKYPVEAFHFVRQGLQFTIEHVHGQDVSEPQHITGKDLCWGLRDFAINRWGLLAPTVLKNWNITRTEDFGQLVFAMVESGVMAKNDNDKLDDFNSVYDFKSAFDAKISAG